MSEGSNNAGNWPMNAAEGAIMLDAITLRVTGASKRALDAAAAVVGLAAVWTRAEQAGRNYVTAAGICEGDAAALAVARGTLTEELNECMRLCDEIEAPAAAAVPDEAPSGRGDGTGPDRWSLSR